MQFSISSASGVAIYQQIVEQICSGIARGKLRPDERLPSVRELSQTLVVNPNTIARAYTELEREGVLYTRRGMGVFVANSRAQLSKKVRRERLVGSLDRLLVESVQLGFTAEELIEFITERTGQFQWNPSTAGVAQ